LGFSRSSTALPAEPATAAQPATTAEATPLVYMYISYCTYQDLGALSVFFISGIHYNCVKIVTCQILLKIKANLTNILTSSTSHLYCRHFSKTKWEQG
jgi:hypothetical protein